MAKDDVKLHVWSPLGHGNKDSLANQVISEIAEKYDKNTLCYFEI